jgi:hypothetical protein
MERTMSTSTGRKMFVNLAVGIEEIHLAVENDPKVLYLVPRLVKVLPRPYVALLTERL